MTILYSVILAGGSGKRLWPLSREMFPKQMLRLDDDYTLFQRTFLNLATIVDDKNIITSTNVKYLSSIKEQLKDIQNKFYRKSEYKILTEPIFKNTAPALTLAVNYISKNINKNNISPIILVVPSDQRILNRLEFTSILQKGIKLAQAGYIVSFASETQDIDENFGYIKARKNPKIKELVPEALKVNLFVEKPSNKDIKETLKGNIFVNSGIYMFSAQTFFSELKKYSPDLYMKLSEYKLDDSIPSISLKDYSELDDISIDYALMEKTKKLALIPLNTEWKDIGSWKAIYDISKKDKNNNCILGKAIDIDSKNSLVYSTSKFTATIGLKDMFVIDTEDAVLICNKNNDKDIKNIYKKINGKNAQTKEIHKTVYRPWGYYTVLEEGEGFLTKCITVNPKAKLSVQLHHHRSEHWIVLEGKAFVIKGKENIELNSGESVDIGIEEIHSLQNNGDVQLKILEVQQGDILDENDIERLEDIYGRV